MTIAANGMMKSETIAAGWSAAFADYKPLPGVPDEFIGADGKPKPQWLQWMQRVSARDVDRSLAVAERHIRDLGISYRVRGEAKERTWPLGGLPLLIDQDEWADISSSIASTAASLTSTALRISTHRSVPAFVSRAKTWKMPFASISRVAPRGRRDSSIRTRG